MNKKFNFNDLTKEQNFSITKNKTISNKEINDFISKIENNFFVTKDPDKGNRLGISEHDLSILKTFIKFNFKNIPHDFNNNKKFDLKKHHLFEVLSQYSLITGIIFFCITLLLLVIKIKNTPILIIIAFLTFAFFGLTTLFSYFAKKFILKSMTELIEKQSDLKNKEINILDLIYECFKTKDSSFNSMLKESLINELYQFEKQMYINKLLNIKEEERHKKLPIKQRQSKYSGNRINNRNTITPIKKVLFTCSPQYIIKYENLPNEVADMSSLLNSPYPIIELIAISLKEHRVFNKLIIRSTNMSIEEQALKQAKDVLI